MATPMPIRTAVEISTFGDGEEFMRLVVAGDDREDDGKGGAEKSDDGEGSGYRTASPDADHIGTGGAVLQPDHRGEEKR